MNIDIPQSKVNEPDWPPLLEKSFLFVPTGGMRSAPDELVLELMREIFYEKLSEGKERKLDPENKQVPGIIQPEYSDLEKVVLYAARGRKKLNRQSNVDTFYTPPYPQLARLAWPRKNTERVVKNFCFSAIAQHLNGSNKNNTEIQREFIKVVIDALKGHNSASINEYKGKEFFSVAIKDMEFKIDEESNSRLEDLISSKSATKYIWKTKKGEDDPLAERIFIDFIHICKLENKLPRLHWLQLFKTFLRISIASWLLAQTRLTILVRDWIIDAIDKGELPDSDHFIIEQINSRYRGLLHASTTYNDEIRQHIHEYMRARIELKVLFFWLEHVSKGEWNKIKEITTIGSGGGNKKTIKEFIEMAGKYRDNIRSSEHSVRQLLTRKCENYPAWANPLVKGQGVTYDELLRVLRRMEIGDEDGGYILTPGKQQRAMFLVFPGHMMLKLITFLSAKRNPNSKLILADVEDHFSRYGMDFTTNEGARPLLIDSLKEIGLLRGSPDAGDSAEIKRPYDID